MLRIARALAAERVDALEHAVPAGLAEGMWERVEAELPPPVRRSNGPRAFPTRLVAGLAAALAVLIFATGWLLGDRRGLAVGPPSPARVAAAEPSGGLATLAALTGSGRVRTVEELRTLLRGLPGDLVLLDAAELELLRRSGPAWRRAAERRVFADLDDGAALTADAALRLLAGTGDATLPPAERLLTRAREAASGATIRY